MLFEVAPPVEKPPAAIQLVAYSELQKSFVELPTIIVDGFAESEAVAGHSEFDGVEALQAPPHWIVPLFDIPQELVLEVQVAPWFETQHEPPVLLQELPQLSEP